MLEKLVSFIVFSFIAITTERSAGGDGGRPRRVPRARRPRQRPRLWGMDGQMDGWKDGWMNRWTDGWTDRQTDGLLLCGQDSVKHKQNC